MNYIILNNSVIERLEEKYYTLCEQYHYTGTFDFYIEDLLSFDNVFKLLNYCCEEGTKYRLLGKGCMLYMRQDNKHKNCFFTTGAYFFENNADFLRNLVQTVELPGAWEFIQIKDAYKIKDCDTEDISYFLSGLKPSNKEFREFEGKWRTWDLYNSKRKELQEKAEEESERTVEKVLLENNVFSVIVNQLSDAYKEDVGICVLFSGDEKFQSLGRVQTVNRQNNQIDIVCQKPEIINEFVNKQTRKIIKIRITDFGTLTRLKRQKDAMKKFFRNEVANINIKSIIMDEFSFDTKSRSEVTIEHAYGLFGSNVRQQNAYIDAINAPDIYLIQGPPGTGKTTIITELVRYAIQNSMKVLVSSDTNIAVDNVLERIQYAENVVPVRLGRIERIGESCIPFMPEKIAESILTNVRKQNAKLDEQGISLDVLISKCREEWQIRDENLDKEIEELRKLCHTNYDLTELLELINQFEVLVFETNEIYMQIETQKQPYVSANNRLLELQKKKAELEELLNIESTDIVDTGFRTADAMSYSNNTEQIKSRLSGVNKSIEEIKDVLLHNKYETLIGSYKRKIRRYERRKQELEHILTIKSSLQKTAHQVKNHILDINVLKEQKKAIKSAMETELETLRLDHQHKQELWEISKDIRSEWVEATNSLEIREEIERIYLKKTNVVFATCIGIAASDNGEFANMEYDYVIIDEAAKCNMLDLLIPLAMGKKIILVGDHKQLYPMLETEGLKDEISEEQIKELKEHILFKWLYEERVPEQYKTMLNRQYRMERSISDFVSENFYDSGLICEKDNHNDPSMMWIDCEDSYEELKGTSYINDPEAKLIISFVDKLDREYDYGIQVGIICTYKAQADCIRGLLKGKTFKNINVECSTVDAFQGKEKHTIIFNTVRNRKATDFMTDENRVNVAVSRAQEYFYAVGSIELIKSKDSGILGKLYHYIKQHGDIRNSIYVR